VTVPEHSALLPIAPKVHPICAVQAACVVKLEHGVAPGLLMQLTPLTRQPA